MNKTKEILSQLQYVEDKIIVNYRANQELLIAWKDFNSELRELLIQIKELKK